MSALMIYCNMLFLSVILSFIFNLNDGQSIDHDPRKDKPNIMFIMVDDLGWGNVGYHNRENPEINTPHIDDLVANGLELNRHYVDAECSPTRTSFQSGRIPVHVNVNNNDGITDPTMGIPPTMTCIASKLKEAGYSTHQIGKWDVGFASYRQIPISRGYDTSFGYLGKSIDYYTKMGDAACTTPYQDLWENDRPAMNDNSGIDKDEYSEYKMAQKVYTKLDEMALTKDPFFIFYASHLPHYPAQLPEDCEDGSLSDRHYVDFENDESHCSNMNDFVFPGYYENDSSQWRCRSVLQAQVHILDHIVGKIVSKLKEHNLWQNTLLVFTTDNGGSLELDYTAGNNYPLRGGKSSMLEGGIRATSFVSGGYLPQHRRGEIENGLMHISDWYVTFSEMLGVDASDKEAIKAGLPDVDGVNMWPLISGQQSESPRSDIVMNKNTLIMGDYKLIKGKSTKYAIWQSAVFPNSSTPSQQVLEESYLTCDSKKHWGCLFNVAEDPTEHNEISEDYPEIVSQMVERLNAERQMFWSSKYNGNDACPERIYEDKMSNDLVVGGADGLNVCGCWMARNNYNGFAGPYQDLTEEQKWFVEREEEEEKDAVVFTFNFALYAALCVATTVLLYVVMMECRAKEDMIDKKWNAPSYGSVTA